MPSNAGMTHAVVVCESMFGNTRAIADAVAASLALRFDRVDVFDVAEAPSSFDGVSLLVVGAPTHAFGMSRRSTRDAAVEQGAAASCDRGVREWLSSVGRTSTPIVAAAFDTRVRKPLVPGSAARAVQRRLRRRGFDVLDPVSFGVEDTPGPLAAGELDRAREWAVSLHDLVGPAAVSPQ